MKALRLTAIVLALAACGGGETSVAAQPATPNVAAPPAPPSDPNRIETRVARAELQRAFAGQDTAASARPEPGAGPGVYRGIRFTNVPPGDLAARVGFRSGDLLTAIAGEPIRDTTLLFDQVTRVVMSIGTAPSIELGIERDGHPMTIVCTLEGPPLTAGERAALNPSMPTQPPAAPRPTTPAPEGFADLERATQIERAIRRVSDTQFEVNRSMGEALLDAGAGTNEARIVPHSEDGTVVGLRLFGIRAGSLPAALGLRNGDTLRTVAGLSITSPEQALQAYSAVRAADNVDVVLERQGAPLTLHYVIR